MLWNKRKTVVGGNQVRDLSQVIITLIQKKNKKTLNDLWDQKKWSPNIYKYGGIRRLGDHILSFKRAWVENIAFAVKVGTHSIPPVKKKANKLTHISSPPKYISHTYQPFPIFAGFTTHSSFSLWKGHNSW